jgi:hypothetical protein
MEDSEIKPHHLQSSDLWPGSQKNTPEKGKPFQSWCWENWLSRYRRLKLYPYFSLCIKINSKQIKDLHEKPETLKLLQEKNRENCKI